MQNFGKILKSNYIRGEPIKGHESDATFFSYDREIKKKHISLQVSNMTFSLDDHKKSYFLNIL